MRPYLFLLLSFIDIQQYTAFPILSHHLATNIVTHHNQHHFHSPTTPTTPTQLLDRRRRNPSNPPPPPSKEEDLLDSVIDSVFSIGSYPLSIPNLPGPPLLSLYPLTLLTVGLLLPGSALSIVASSTLLFVLFLIVGRTLVFTNDDENNDAYDDYKDGEEEEEGEGAAVDLIALGGAIVSAYVVLPPTEFVTGSTRETPFWGWVGGFAAGSLLIGSLWKVVSDNRKMMERDEGMDDKDDYERRRMDAWDQKLRDEEENEMR